MQELIPLSLYDINSDKPSDELPPDVYTNGANIRFDDGFIEKSKGWTNQYTPSVAPLHLMNIVSGTTSYWLYAGTNKIYAEDGGTPGRPFDLTTAYSISTTVDIRWNSTYFNGLPILNAKTAVPVYWDLNTTNDVQAIPGWVSGDQCDVIRSYKNFLIAINITSGGTKNNNLIKWSSRASAGSLPSTWTPAATNAAGDKEFSASKDILIDGLQLKDFFVIYKQKSCYMMYEIGGQYIFDFKDLFGDFGALAEGCVVEFDKKHAVLTVDDFVVHDGNTWQSVIDSRMRKTLFNSINDNYIDTCYVVHKQLDNEILICFPDVTSTLPNKCLTWNYRENVWYPFADIPGSYIMAPGIFAGTFDDTWDVDTQVWDADNSFWDQNFYSSVADFLMIAGYTDTKLYVYDKASYNADGTYINSYIERTSIPLINYDKQKFVSELWPDIRALDGTEFTISIGFQDRPNDSITWKEFNYIVGTHQKADFDIKGRFISFRITDKADVYWKMGARLQIEAQEVEKW